MEKPLRFDRMSGLSAEQLNELEQRVGELLKASWNKGIGRPRELTLREAQVVSCGYARNNITEEVWSEIFDVDQATISRYITQGHCEVVNGLVSMEIASRVCRAWRRRAWAMLSWSARRRTLITRFLRMASTCGPFPVRAWWRSSPRV